MIKRLHLIICFSVFAVLMGSSQNGQNPALGISGTQAPSQQWEDWMSKEVEKYKENLKNSQAKPPGYVIPVIVHVIHFGETVGTFPNIDSNQVKSQIQVLNDDFNANGQNIGQTPSVFSHLIASTGIKFCRAKQNPVGTPLPEPGIDRVAANSNSWQSPATPTLDLQNYFNTVIIPATIWDPVKYLNIWVSDRPASSNLRGFATYPAGTTLNGLFGGNIGTSTNDGIWVYARYFGTTGSVTSPFDKGRTAVHELGHWLGLRNIWGDGNCLSDYCGDTPTSKFAHYGCTNYTNTPIDQCGVGQSPVGEMPFNFMDMTDDLCKWMFTKDQNIRIQVAMSQCGNRNQLGTHGLCNVVSSTPSSSAIASFNFNSTACLGQPSTPFNTSNGFPHPTYVWSSAPAASFSPATTVANPAITFNNPGTYTITLVATNSVSSSSHSMVVTANFTCNPGSLCLDTLRMIKDVDSLKTYRAPNTNNIIGCQNGFAGYLVGNNCYKDKEFAQFFPPYSYSTTPFPQVNSVIVLFDSIGTKASFPTTQVKCKIYGGNVTTGPGLAIGIRSDSLSKITSSPKVTSTTLVGKPNVALNNKVIPFKFNFNSPIIINNVSGFYAGIEGPLSNSMDSINIVANTKYNTSVDSSAWFLSFLNNWRTYRQTRGYKIQLAILPQITCSPILDVKEYQASLAANVNVFPNPNNGVFNLIFTLPKKDKLNLEIYSSLGQVISKESLDDITNNVVELDLSSRPNGVYFARISNGKESVVKKIVVTR